MLYNCTSLKIHSTFTYLDFTYSTLNLGMTVEYVYDKNIQYQLFPYRCTLIYDVIIII